MENPNIQTQDPKDPTLWKIAKKRAAFKQQVIIYLLVNLLLWIVWYSTWKGGHIYSIWPIYVTFGWGIGIFFSYIDAYMGFKHSLAQKEYDKLIKQ